MSILMRTNLMPMWRITSLLVLSLGVLCAQSDYFAIQRNGLWGMEDRKGTVLIEPSYSHFKVFPKFCLAQDRNQIWTIYFNYQTHQTFRKADQIEWYWDNYIMVRQEQVWMMYAITQNSIDLIADHILSYEVYGSQILLWNEKNVEVYYGAQKMGSFEYEDPYEGDIHTVCFEQADGANTQYHTFCGGKYWISSAKTQRDSFQDFTLSLWNTQGARYQLYHKDDTLEFIHVYQELKDTLFLHHYWDSTTTMQADQDLKCFYVNWENKALLYNEALTATHQLSIVKPFYKRLNYSYLISKDHKELLLWKENISYYQADSIQVKGQDNHLRLILHKGTDKELMFLEPAPKNYPSFAHLHASDTLIDLCQWGKKTRLIWTGEAWEMQSEKEVICFAIQNFESVSENIFEAPINLYWRRSTNSLVGLEATGNWGRWNEQMLDFEECPKYTSVENLRDSCYTLCWTPNYCRLYDEIAQKWLFTARELLYKGLPNNDLMIFVSGPSKSQKTYFKNVLTGKGQIIDHPLRFCHEKNGFLWFYGGKQFYLYNLKTEKLQVFPNIKEIQFSIYDNYVFKNDANQYGILSYDAQVKVEPVYYKVTRKGKYFELIGHQANYALGTLNGTQKTAQIFGVPKVKSHYFTAFDQEKELYDSNGLIVPKPFGTNVYKEIKSDQYVIRKGKKHILLNVEGKILHEAKEMVLICKDVIAYFDQGKTCLYNIKTQKKIHLNAWGKIEGIDEQLFLYGNPGQQDLMSIAEGKVIIKSIRHWEILEDGNYYFESSKSKGIIFPKKGYAIKSFKNLSHWESTIDAYAFYTPQKAWIFDKQSLAIKMILPKGQTRYLGYHRWIQTDPATRNTQMFHHSKMITQSNRWHHVEPFNQYGLACTDWGRRFGIIDTNAMWVLMPKFKQAKGIDGGYFMVNHQLFSPNLKFLSNSISKIYTSNADIIIYRDHNYRIGISDAQFNAIYPPIIDKYKKVGSQSVLLGSWEYKMLMDLECKTLLGGTYQDLEINEREQTVSVRYFANLYHYDLKTRAWIDQEHMYVE